MLARLFEYPYCMYIDKLLPALKYELSTHDLIQSGIYITLRSLLTLPKMTVGLYKEPLWGSVLPQQTRLETR